MPAGASPASTAARSSRSSPRRAANSAKLRERAGAPARAGQRGRQQGRDRAHRAAEARAADQRAGAGERARARGAGDLREHAVLGNARPRRRFRSCASRWNPTCCQGNSATGCCCSPGRAARARFPGAPGAGGRPDGGRPQCYDHATRARRRPKRSAFRLAFKHFQRIDGSFRVSPKAQGRERAGARLRDRLRRAESDAERDAGLSSRREHGHVSQGKQAAEPHRQPDRRHHAHRGQCVLQRRPARRRRGARQRRGAARPAGHAGGLGACPHRRRSPGGARGGERHRSTGRWTRAKRSNSRPIPGSKEMCTTRASKFSRARSSRGGWCTMPPKARASNSRSRSRQQDKRSRSTADERSHRDAGSAGLHRQRGEQGQAADRRRRQSRSSSCACSSPAAAARASSTASPSTRCRTRTTP